MGRPGTAGAYRWHTAQTQARIYVSHQHQSGRRSGLEIQKRKYHKDSDTLNAFLRDLEQNGSKLAHEWIAFEHFKYRCTHREKSGDIYEVFDNHINTNNHARARRNAGRPDQPAKPTAEEAKA